MKIVSEKDAYEFFDRMRERAYEAREDINDSAKRILSDIRERGFDAVVEYSEKFDKTAPYEIDRHILKRAYDCCDENLRRALEVSADNIREYHKNMNKSSWELDRGNGRRVGQVVRALGRVGIYVPGGTAAYPSSVLMNAVPAKVAGVSEIIMATPPTDNLNEAVLAAAYIAGVDRVFAVGGVQAIGALAYGAGFIPKVDKIVGPGNAYVAAAKRVVFGTVDIDMIAGPSEVLIIADDSANPAYVAADLLSQAEHDKLASAILLTDSEILAENVIVELKKQTLSLSRKEIIESSLKDFGAAVVCESMESAVQLANSIAPEHLELMTRSPRSLLPLVKNAGAVFLGEYSPEALGDYIAGPSHVLPTSGSARFFSPLSVDTFLKKMSVIEYSKEALDSASDSIRTLAYSEKLTAHAASVEVRK